MEKSINKVTVVSALYYIGRDKWKHSGFGLGNDAYKNWVKNLLSVDCHLYFFVDDYYYDFIVEHRKKYDPTFEKTVIHKTSLSNLVFYRAYYESLSRLMSSPEFRSKVPGTSSAELNYCLYNIINFNKIEFVQKAFRENLFGSDYFFWADAGGMRNSIEEYENKAWPAVSSEYFNDKIIHFSHADEFTVDSSKFNYFVSQNRRIQGTAWIVPKDLVNTYYDLIYNEVDSIIKNSIVGSDEKVYDYLYVTNKQLFQLKKSNWFEYYKMCLPSQEIKKKVKILTVVYSKPEFIELQYKQLKKFCKDDFELVIINNAKDVSTNSSINSICHRLGLNSIHAPKEHSIANSSHFNALNHGIESIVKKDKKSAAFVIIDNDVFAYREFSFLNMLGDAKVASGVYQQRQDEAIEYLHPIFSIISNDIDLADLDFSWKTYTDTGGRTDDFIKKYNLTPKWLKHTAAIDIETDYIFTKNNDTPYPYKPSYKSQFIEDCFFHYYRGDNWDQQQPNYHLDKYRFTLYFLHSFEEYGLNLDDKVHYEKAHAEKGWEGKDFHYHGYRFAELKKESPQGKKVFVDMGAHEQQGLGQFKNILHIDSNWTVHCFEPNNLLSLDNRHSDLNVTMHNKAVWTYNGELSLNLYGLDRKSQGSTVVGSAGSEELIDLYDVIKIPCIDAYEFLKSFNEEDEVYIKMDIEWSEYDVLEYLLDKGWLKNIKKVWVEWHGTHLPEIQERKYKIIERLKNYSTEIENWH